MASSIELSVRKRKGWAVILTRRANSRPASPALAGRKNYATAGDGPSGEFRNRKGSPVVLLGGLRKILPPHTFEKLAGVVGFAKAPAAALNRHLRGQI